MGGWYQAEKYTFGDKIAWGFYAPGDQKPRGPWKTKTEALQECERLERIRGEIKLTDDQTIRNQERVIADLIKSKLRGKTFTAEPCAGCAEREAKIAELEAQLRARSATATQRLDRIAELEQRPTHESVAQWLEALSRVCDAAAKPTDNYALMDDAVALMETASVYRAEFMEPADAD